LKEELNDVRKPDKGQKSICLRSRCRNGQGAYIEERRSGKEAHSPRKRKAGYGESRKPPKKKKKNHQVQGRKKRVRRVKRQWEEKKFRLLSNSTF